MSVTLRRQIFNRTLGNSRANNEEAGTSSNNNISQSQGSTEVLDFEPEQQHEEDENGHMDKVLLILQILAIGFLIVCIFVGLIISKGMLLFATSQIGDRHGSNLQNNSRRYLICTQVNNTLFNSKDACVLLFKETERSKVLNKCNNDKVFVNKPLNMCIGVTLSWIRCLFLIMITPEIFTLIRSLYYSIFKESKWPTLRVFIPTIITEFLSACGTAVLILATLPYINSIYGFGTLFFIEFIPSILKFLSSILMKRIDATEEKTNTSFKLKLLVTIFFPLCLGVFFGTAVAEKYTGKKDLEGNKRYAAFFVGIILTSLRHCLKYITVIYKLCSKENETEEEKVNENPQCYPKLSVIVSLIRAITLIILCPVIIHTDDMVKLNYKDFFAKNIADCTNDENINHFTKDWHKFYFIIASVQLITYFFIRTALKLRLNLYISAAVLASDITLLGFLIFGCPQRINSPCSSFFRKFIPSHLFWNCPNKKSSQDRLYITSLVFLFLSTIAISAKFFLSIKIISSTILSKTKEIFYLPFYDVFLNSCITENIVIEDPRRQISNVEHSTPYVFLCATMWHEEEFEMKTMLNSIFRLDLDHKICSELVYKDKNMNRKYNFEANIWFDDAFVDVDDETHGKLRYVNKFVKMLINCVPESAAYIYRTTNSGILKNPDSYVTPYGGRLEWTTPYGNKLIVHLKDKKLIRHKKRWSQILYMFNIIDKRILKESEQPTVGNFKEQLLRHKKQLDNTFILALDGDVDFKPKAVHRLLEVIQQDLSIGAACGRIHPVSKEKFSVVTWYQKFEYAIGHWLQKATEHVLGCVLCAPGCFSLFRASALADNAGIMKMYARKTTCAGDIIQCDQGEDRWLCTLLIQNGKRIAYVAAADAVTFCPEDIDVFFEQRRRWAPSTTLNILDLITSGNKTRKNNQNISLLYLIYQSLLFISSMFGPGVILLVMISSVKYASEQINEKSFPEWVSVLINVIPVVIFALLCFFSEKKKTTLLWARIFSILYTIIQTLVLIAIIKDIINNWRSPTSMFFIFVASVFILAAILHPQEASDVIFGVIYFFMIPSMYLLLQIYAFSKMNDIGWGVRETSEEKKSDPHILDQMKNRCCYCCYGKNPEPNEPLSTVEIDNVAFVPDNMQTSSPQSINLVSASTVPLETDIDDVIISPVDFRSDPEIEKILNTENNLSENETIYYQNLIEKYLEPEITPTAEEKAKIEKDLRKKRNQFCTMMFFFNLLFIIVVLTLQMNDKMKIPWPLSKEKLDPIGIVFLFFFVSVLVLQTSGMVYHRMSTLILELSTLTLNGLQNKKIKKFDTKRMEKIIRRATTRIGPSNLPVDPQDKRLNAALAKVRRKEINEAIDLESNRERRILRDQAISKRGSYFRMDPA